MTITSTQLWSTTGLSLYAVILDSLGNDAVRTDLQQFETYNADHWPNYAIPFTEKPVGGVYKLDFPSFMAMGAKFIIRIYQLSAAGAPPAPTDKLMAQRFDTLVFSDDEKMKREVSVNVRNVSIDT